jgi:hypothetical protein
LRDDADSERVRILAVTTKKTSTRVDVAFVDDPAGRKENCDDWNLLPGQPETGSTPPRRR